MKRSEIKRKAPLRAKAPMNRKREKRTAPKRKVSDTRFRSPAYLAWVRTLPCCACGVSPCDAHHMVGMYGVGGMGLKAEDSMAMPLCRACHMDLHREPGWLKHQPHWLRHTIALGVQQFDDETRQALREVLAFIDERERAA
ncbi:DUF968 domain-containing protein [Chromohalobacter sp. HP20-39]|uniref:DUF968 domain-containing protein n=1 Tax=Chromohalobacter sp. HP20-39 TaxID=3079306 RepID=UPI00294B5CCD|nr:DUF968 domain-containing protein [Chromohalobacter sp. HP20-39]MDV6318783.1 DUF968 domain-containing protein [Chromohalobacter sp. HP20-39]